MSLELDSETSAHIHFAGGLNNNKQDNNMTSYPGQIDTQNLTNLVL